MSEQVQVIYVDPTTLNPHPRNTEFFDDLTGTKWEEFLGDIGSRGIRNPLLINGEGIIISGCQRWRAACELNLETVPVIRYEYPNEDSELLDLIANNLQQRFSPGNSDLKTARCAQELKRICGRPQGRPSYGKENVVKCSTFSGVEQNGTMSQEQIAALLKVPPRSLRYLMTLLKLSPELQNAVEEGSIATSVAARALSQLSQDEQRELLLQVSPETLGKMSLSELQEIIPQVKELYDEKESLRTEVQLSHREVYSQSELDEALTKKDELEQKLRQIYEKMRTANKEHSQEVKELKQQHEAEKSKMVRLQGHMSDLKRIQQIARELAKLDEKDLVELKPLIIEAMNPLNNLVQQLEESA